MAAIVTDPEPLVDIVVEPPEDEVETPEAPTNTRAMVALLPANPDGLVVENGDPADSLHVTMRFLGDAADLSEPLRMAIQDDVASVAMGVPPITVLISGIIIMGSNDDGQPATALLLESPELMEVHGELCEELDGTAKDASEHSEGSTWIPHITLGYGLDPNMEHIRAMVGMTFTLDRLSTHFGDDVTEYPLVVGTDESPAVDAEDDDESEIDELAMIPEGEMKKYGKHATWDECVADATAKGKIDADAYCGEIKKRVKLGKAVPGMTISLVAAASPQDDMTVDEETGEWNGIITVEGVPFGDGRMIQPEALTWRTLPLPLMVMFKNPDSGASGHAGAELCGRIDFIERRPGPNPGTFLIWARGVLDLGSEAGREAARLMADKFLRGVSVDLDSLIAESENEIPDFGPDAPIDEILAFDPGMLLIVEARIAGSTLCSIPAIQEATIQLGRGDPVLEDALVASCGPMRDEIQGRTWMPLNVEAGALVASGSVETSFPVHPPLEWLSKRKYAGPTPARVTPDGRLYGHVASLGACHVGYSRCVSPPLGDGQYRYFQNKMTLTAEGTEVATGPLVIDTVHPDLAWSASDAQSWYHNTGSAVADIHVYNDEWGIAIAGAMRPTATMADARAVRGSDISPDWRPIQGEREAQAIAFLSVNASGFITPALVASAGPGWVKPGTVRARIDVTTDEVVAMVGASSIRESTNISLSEVMAELSMLRSEVAKFRDAVRPIRDKQAREKVRLLALTNGHSD